MTGVDLPCKRLDLGGMCTVDFDDCTSRIWIRMFLCTVPISESLLGQAIRAQLCKSGIISWIRIRRCIIYALFKLNNLPLETKPQPTACPHRFSYVDVLPCGGSAAIAMRFNSLTGQRGGSIRRMAMSF